MKQRLAIILIILGLSLVFMFFGGQNIAEAEKTVEPSRANQTDTDGDGVPDFRDNCPVTPNPEKIAFASYRNGDYEIYIMNADGTNQINLTNSRAKDIDPAFSRDGSKIAFVTECNNNNYCNIYVMNADGSNRTRLTDNLMRDRYPSFSPDGNKIVFARQSSDLRHTDIYVMDADGSNPKRLTDNPSSDFDAKFSPDGSKIIFWSNRDGGSHIYEMNADGSNPKRLTNNISHGSRPAYSPDGSKIVFNSSALRDDGYYNTEIFVMNSDGSNPIRLTNNSGSSYEATFSPDGSKIAFRTIMDGGRDKIYVMNSDGSNQIRLTNNVSDSDPAWSRQADSDGDGIGDACENILNRNRFLNFPSLLGRSNYFIEAVAGSSIPVSFSLNGFMGFDIYSAPPSSQQISCFDKTPLEPSQPILTFPSDPSYNSVFDLYLMTWRTQAAWAGTCRRLVLTFNNGTTKTMDYRFR